MLFVNYLRSQELFHRLAGVYETVEGNLLERADDRTTEAQVEAIRYAVHRARPARVLETGSNKSLFGYVLSHVTHDVVLYTFDADPRCATGVELLNAAQTNVKTVFTLGDTKQALAEFHVPEIGFAWIDGGHDAATVASDLFHAMRLAVPLIAVDDTRTMPEVANAVEAALRANRAYRRGSNPFFEDDARGIALLERV